MVNMLFNEVLGENEKCIFYFYLKTQGTFSPCYSMGNPAREPEPLWATVSFQGRIRLSGGCLSPRLLGKLPVNSDDVVVGTVLR